MAHSDLTPYSAYMVAFSEARANGHTCGNMGKISDCATATSPHCPSSQAFYGYHKSELIAGYKQATRPYNWFDGDAFAEWLASWREGKAQGSRSSATLASLLAEYAAPVAE
jgi:hypothetical protein